MSKERARQRKRQQTKQMQKLQAKIEQPVVKKEINTQARLYETSYEITTEPLPNTFPPEIDSQAEDLYFLAQEKPKQAIPKLQELITKYPEVPELYNWLGAAYNASGDRDAYRRTVQLNYEKNPSYLFAKLGYAELCIVHNELDKVVDIFDSKLDLALLYPDRNVFHISEVSSFFSLLALYFLAKGDIELAKQYYNILVQIAPEERATQIVAHKFLFHLLD